MYLMATIVVVTNNTFYLEKLMGNLVDVVALVQLLGVTVATVHAQHRRGWIPCFCVGRRPILFDFEWAEKTLKESTKGGHN